MAKVKMNWGKCTVAVVGVDMNCPLCGTLVKSGERHECEKREPQKKLTRKKRDAVRG